MDDELDLIVFVDLARQLPPSTRLQLLADYVAELADDPAMFAMFQAGVELRLLHQNGAFIPNT